MNITLALETIAAWIWETSWQASVLVALVLLVQWLFGRKLAPRWRYGLWLLVVARLALPVAPESPLSVFNWVRVSPVAEPPFTVAAPDRFGRAVEDDVVQPRSEPAPLAVSGAETSLAPAKSAAIQPPFVFSQRKRF